MEDQIDDRSVVAVERAMVEIRRLQQRRTLGRVSRQRGGDGIDPTLTAVVDAVERHDLAGLACTVSTVAAAIGVDQPRASRLVARAVDAGLVERTADRSDGRRVRLTLTRAGRQHSAQVHSFRREMFAEAMAGWSPRQVATFARLLTSFVESYGRLVR